ncbi:hypothetical protein, partial [Methylacidiphilum sp. Yel]|uniref:hypothetical protein n=1 Tax=Methylacidiphilum sp. Yel TaxID=1847730 RepID=UPI001ABC658C
RFSLAIARDRRGRNRQILLGVGNSQWLFQLPTMNSIGNLQDLEETVQTVVEDLKRSALG